MGRDAACDICVRDAAASRTHLVLERVPGGWWLTDVSTNGTLLNGAPVDRSVLLGSGARLTIAGTDLVLHDPVVGTESTGTEVRPVGGPESPGMVAEPDRMLSPREYEALVELCRPLASGERFIAPARVADLAKVLHVSEQRVQALLAGASDKLGVPMPLDRVALANQALASGAVTEEQLRTQPPD